MKMDSSASRFDKAGNRWDTRRDIRDPRVQALCEIFDRTDREVKAEGYDGPLKPVKHGRDFQAPRAVHERIKPLKLIERNFSAALAYKPPVPSPYLGKVFGTIKPPSDAWIMQSDDEIEAETAKHLVWVAAERAKLSNKNSK